MAQGYGRQGWDGEKGMTAVDTGFLLYDENVLKLMVVVGAQVSGR